ncbi:sulfotransferase domain-containing protein [uncultured Paraglaciecola sp.]|nr:sulfotransferase domain-containing protein [uncultured Paraglaciecola sp.]
MFIHFSALKKNVPNEIRKITSFIEAHIRNENWLTSLEYCSFKWMKENAT